MQFNQNALLVGNTVAGTPGMMPNRSAENFYMPGLESTAWAGDRVFIRPPGGFFDGGSWVTAPVPGLTPGNLREGVDVLGIIGTLVPKKYASGSLGTVPAGQPISVGGLPFIPNILVIRYTRHFINGTGSYVSYLFRKGSNYEMLSTSQGISAYVMDGSSSVNLINITSGGINGTSFVEDLGSSDNKTGVVWSALE